jgi:hypothetical protein
LSPNSAQKNTWFERALLIRPRKYTIYILKLGTWVGAGAPRLNPAPALRTPILLRKLMESVALGVFGAHKQGVGTLSPTHRRLRQPLRRQRCTARPRFTRPAWPRRALRSRHQRDSGETRFFTFFGNFWLTIQNTANRQVRNLFLEVSWLYLSRFPGALCAPTQPRPPFWWEGDRHSV